jgi:Zn-dependent protease with chaperone function
MNAFVLPVSRETALYSFNSRSDLFHVLFQFQNGNIFVFTGMLNICTTDDELGMVLGHEISHCLLGHAVSL